MARGSPAAERDHSRPSPAELRAAAGRTIPDVIGPGLRVLFCGINPGLYSGAVGHHFARPGNRFWKALHGAGFTESVLSAFEGASLVACGIGITNLCRRTTARAEELAPGELRSGARVVAAKVRRLRPAVVAVLGVGAYRIGFGRPATRLGPQPERLGGAALWVLPNPSGLNAHYSLGSLIRHFRALYGAVAWPAAGLTSSGGRRHTYRRRVIRASAESPRRRSALGARRRSARTRGRRGPG